MLTFKLPHLRPFTLLLCLPMAALSRADDEPAPARLAIERPPFLVGQVVELEVSLVAGSLRPAIRVPQVQGLQINPAGISLQSLSTDSIGAVVNERIRYRYLFHLVPLRAGSYQLPPFRLLEGRTEVAATPRATFTVQSPPLGPSTFLGGIGPLQVSVRASPSSVRVGQSVDYLIRLEGPGALGTRLPPALDRLSRLPISPQVAWLGSESIAEPPARLFRYRLTPSAPGDVRLPPVLISWFDPRSGQFQTSVGPAVELSVRTAPAFDPNLLEYEARAAPSSSPGRIRLQPPHLTLPDMRAWLAACLALPALALAVSSYRRRSPRRQVSKRLRAALRDPQPRDASAAYRQAAQLLELSLNLPPAVPATVAEDRIRSLTANPELARQVRETLESGQSARFSPSRELPADWLKRLVTLLIRVEAERAECSP